jgi:hypothetical protein
MDTLAPLSVTIAGTLATILIGLAIALFRQLSKTVAEMTRAVAVLQTILVGAEGTPGLVDRVNALHQWRNELQARELAQVRAENERLRRQREDES